MPQHERVQWAQLRVGALVIVGLTLFAVAVFFISGQVGFFTRHYTLKAYLPSAGDLREGAQVRLAGITVGNVAKIAERFVKRTIRLVAVVLTGVIIGVLGVAFFAVGVVKWFSLVIPIWQAWAIVGIILLLVGAALAGATLIGSRA